MGYYINLLFGFPYLELKYNINLYFDKYDIL